jgi:hypothetical protein
VLRYPPAVETVLLWLLWLLCSGAVSVGITVARQTLRHF